MTTGPKTQRGGARAGSGRKKHVHDPSFVAAVKEAESKYAKKHNLTVAELLLQKIYSAQTEVQQIQALKLYCDLMKGVGGDEQDEKKRVGPVVLPAKRPDPASVPLKKTESKKVVNE